MFEQIIPWKNEVRYLGISFDNHLRFNNQVEHAKTRGQMVRGQLNSLVNRRSKMSIKNKITIYRTMIRPSMMYGSAIWGTVSHTQLQKLQVVQNKFLRAAFNAPWFVRNTQLHREANLPTIKEFLLDDARKFYAKAAVRPNPLVRESVNYDGNAPMRHKRPKYSAPGPTSVQRTRLTESKPFFALVVTQKREHSDDDLGSLQSPIFSRFVSLTTPPPHRKLDLLDSQLKADQLEFTCCATWMMAPHLNLTPGEVKQMMEELQVLRELVVTLRKETDDTLALLATSDVRSHIEEEDDDDDDPEMDVSPSTPPSPESDQAEPSTSVEEIVEPENGAPFIEDPTGNLHQRFPERSRRPS
ncbi:hypothetical protein GEV33_005370 [Tenebrio molitor]|uniref:RNA-directed DNA polymerase from transposon X-element n=1 Tax=Tenebrio molitor TaxID=7067 RepID=A0A8J6HNZ5_TENMO|nr:hypothetical protein GEV33_005370 [Tenebrio molitor]